MRRAYLLAGFAALLILGCGGQPEPKVYDPQMIELSIQFRKVVAAYNQAYQAKKRPLTADDLKPFLKKVGDPDLLLKSPRDGKTLVIVPGFTPDLPIGGNERSIIAYEQTGADGQRMTVDVRGTIRFVSDSEFPELHFVGGHKPSP